MVFDRTNTSLFGKWWWTVDRMTLIMVAFLMAIGMVLVMAASPSIAENKGLPSFYFVHRQSIFLVLGVGIIFFFSLLRPSQIKVLSILGLIGGILLLIGVQVFGVEAKGAKRWISLFGFVMQPSEMVKPFFVVITAWILELKNTRDRFPGYTFSALLYGLIASLLLMQPDFGMTLSLSAVWGMQLFLAGLPLIWVMTALVLGIGGIVSGYIFFDHVRQRIDNFLNPASGDNYQVSKSIQAFQTGGFLGEGPGEGRVKDILPDAHTDFIFAVSGEELGVIVSLVIVFVFAFIVVRGFYRVFHETDLFIVYAASGLLIQFGLQAIINMSVTLNLVPNTGMTLPFVSYGGSSLIAVSITMGMILSLTRRRYGTTLKKTQ